MFEIPKFEFKTETRWYMFLAAKLFGRKLTTNMYQWRGAIWVTGEVPDPFENPAQSEGE